MNQRDRCEFLATTPFGSGPLQFPVFVGWLGQFVGRDFAKSGQC